MITIGELRLRYIEFSDEDFYPDARLQLFIDDAVLIMKEEHRWLDYYHLAQAALVGHLISVNEDTAAGGGGSGMSPIKRQVVDDVAIDNAVGDLHPSESLLYSTTYGKLYLSYVRYCFTTILGV